MLAEFFNTTIDEIPIDKLDLLIDKMGIIIENSKETLIASIKASTDSPAGIINTYYAKVLVNSDDFDKRIDQIRAVTKEDIMNLSKKINIHTIYLLEGTKQEENQESQGEYDEED